MRPSTTLDTTAASRPATPRRTQIRILAAISAGGVCGAVTRAAISDAWPHRPSGFAWATLTINVTGCLLIGVLMVLVTQRWPDRRLLRPFLGVGVLGGYTTFSTSILDLHQATAAGHPTTALAYLAATLTGAMIAVWAGHAATTRLVTARTRPSPTGEQA